MKLLGLRRRLGLAPPPVADNDDASPNLFDRSTYIASPIPIESELHELLDSLAELTIFDIGACEGEDSVRYSRLFPAARIYAVEAVPSNVERCRATVSKYGARNVVIVPYALADTDGIHTMYVSSGSPPGVSRAGDWDYGNKSSSLLEPGLHQSIHPWVEFSERIQVETRRLDTVCDELGVKRIDFIHLDVQGAELMVLAGAGSYLADVAAVWLEVEAVALYRGQPLAAEVASFMRHRGFALRNDTVGPVSGDQLWIQGKR